MPGSVQNAAPVAVLPVTLSRAFVHEREYAVLDNEYRNGESQRSMLASTSRKRWKLAKRLTPSQIAELRSFYEARKGATEAFFFYDPYDTAHGRYAVRFDSSWEQTASPGRIDTEIALIEVT